MALFSGINIKNNNIERKGPFSTLDEGLEDVGSKSYRYPLDVGGMDKGHFVCFTPRKQIIPKLMPDSSLPETAYASALDASSIYGSSPPTATPSTMGASRTGSLAKFLNKTKQTTDYIVLYMPDTLMYSQNQNYSDLSLTDSLFGQMAAAGQSVIDATKGSKAKTAYGAAMKTGAAYLASKFGGLGQATFFGVTGNVINPMLELIYRSPSFRTFQFDFSFYPKNSQEAKQVQQILERFRYHQAPQLAKDVNNSPEYGFLVPPSEFDINFYYGANENPNIPRIATCVLTSMNINYAPHGFHAYETLNLKPEIGGTGMPVAINLQLMFKEVTYLTKDDFGKDIQIDKT